MFSRLMVLLLALFLYVDDSTESLAKSRQKRCIVIQKQSGSHGDSAEGADDDDEGYRQPRPKEPSAERLRRPKDSDAENLPSDLLRYRMLPNIPINREYRLRHRMFKKYL